MKIIKQITFLILFMSNIFAYSSPVLVGIAKYAPPFSEVDTSNHYFGFCIDLINELCKRMNETCQYKAFPMEDMLNELDKGTIDFSLTPTPIPQTPYQGYVFSIPFMTSKGQFVTSNSDIKSLADLKDKKIGVLAEASLKPLLLLYTSNDNIKEYLRINELIDALVNNDLDAILLNEHVFKYLTTNQVIDFIPVDQPINLGNGYGIVALDKNILLINKINKALLEMENDGTYKKIYVEYFGK